MIISSDKRILRLHLASEKDLKFYPYKYNIQTTSQTKLGDARKHKQLIFIRT